MMSMFQTVVLSVALVLLAHTAEAFSGVSRTPLSHATLTKNVGSSTTLGPVARNGLGYEEVEIGTGRNVFAGDTVVCYYVGQYTTKSLMGEKKVTFDETEPGEPAQFVVGKGQVIKGFDIGICGDMSLDIPAMKIGGDRKLKIPAYLAYGERGAGEAIPPNTDLEFQVSILSAQSQEGLSKDVLLKGFGGLAAFLVFMAGFGFLLVETVFIKH